MSRIRVVETDEVAWNDIETTTADHTHVRRTRVLQQGDESTPELHEVTYPPDAIVRPHAHDADEIMYVTAGSIVLGNRVLLPGASILITSHTLYAFRAGSDGLGILNFRVRGGVAMIEKDELMQERADRKSPRS